MSDERPLDNEKTAKVGTLKCPDCGELYTAAGTDTLHKGCAWGGTLLQMPQDQPGQVGPITPRQNTPPSSRGAWTPPSSRRGGPPTGTPRTPLSPSPQRPSSHPTGDSPRPLGGTGTGQRNPPPEVMEAMKDPATIMGKYVLIKVLGKGGMGEVWKAWERKIGRYVAIKFLMTQNEDDVIRFQREAEVAASVQHPHIASIYEFDDQPRPYIVMQYIDGRSLANVKLPPDEALALMQKVCEAVHFAHQKGIIHRDLKPANIMVNSDNWPFVMDFGLAKQVDAGTTLSAFGQIMGTPQFMAPEQAQPETNAIDARADVYGLGSTMYSMLTGKPPFPGKSAAEIVMKVIHEEPQPPSKMDPSIPKEVEKITLHALEKKPENRYQTAAEMAADIGSVRRGDTGVRYKPVSARRRDKKALLITLVSLLVLGGLGAGGYFWSQRDRTGDSRPPAPPPPPPPEAQKWVQEFRNLRRPLERDSFKTGDPANKERAAKLNAHLRTAGDISANVIRDESKWFPEQAEPGLQLLKVWLSSDSNIRIEHKPDAQRMIEWATMMQELLKTTDDPTFTQTAAKLDPLIASAQRLFSYAGKAILRINIHPSARIHSLKAGDQWVIKDGKVVDATRLSLPDAGDLDTPAVFQDLEIDDYVIELANDELKKKVSVVLDRKRMEHGKEYFLTGSITEDNSIKLRP